MRVRVRMHRNVGFVAARMMAIALAFALAPACVPAGSAQQSRQPRMRWTRQAANEWYARQPWLVGSDYIPSYAINQL
ncbi:MAG TPA: hypothetical protein VJR26_11085, partial [Candidatus Acidoferrales bacterium]|nr:hypothetical protein [Candidatus Acidoferrales bacterium]